MRNLFLILAAIPVFYSCRNNPLVEDKVKQDSIVTAEKVKQVQEEKKKNIYLIEPPDTNYTGDYLDKYPNGNVKFQGFFRFGKRHGQWMAYYASGLLWSECFYDKGIRHGANNVYYEDGKPHYKGWYKNDLRDSTWTFYDTIGKVIEHIKFKNDDQIK